MSARTIAAREDGDSPLATEQFWHEYAAWGSPSTALVTVRRHAGALVAIASETDRNGGPSVTNTAEVLWPGLARRLGVVTPAEWLRFVAIEHYPERGDRRQRLPESFARVTLVPRGKGRYGVHWDHLYREVVEALAGGALDLSAATSPW